jgi:hypothetical protein
MSRGWLIAGAVAFLAVGPAQAFQVFNSRTNSPSDRAPGVVQGNGTVTNLNIWIDTNGGGVGDGNAGTGSTCSGPNTTGDYSCAWDLEFEATGSMRITGFTPTPAEGPDYIVMHPTSFTTPATSLRMNGGKPAGPVYEINEKFIGTLQVQATGPTGEVRLKSGSTVLTTLDLDAIDTPATLASVCALGQGPDPDCDGLQGGADNCPDWAQSSAVDTDGDGRGNECECTDVNGDGENTVSDLIGINNCIFAPDPKPPACIDFCDGNNDLQCNVSDLIAANVELFSPTSTTTCARHPTPGP